MAPVQVAWWRGRQGLAWSRTPNTGRPLKVSNIELSDRTICPARTELGAGGYVSFESDLRLAFACPTCQKFVWIAGS